MNCRACEAVNFCLYVAMAFGSKSKAWLECSKARNATRDTQWRSALFEYEICGAHVSFCTYPRA
jgi:hypothetical protein